MATCLRRINHVIWVETRFFLQIPAVSRVMRQRRDNTRSPVNNWSVPGRNFAFTSVSLGLFSPWH